LLNHRGIDGMKRRIIYNIMKKIAIVGIQGIPANYGGFETLAENLVSNKGSDDIEYTVYCSSKSYREKRSTYKGARLIYLPLNSNGIQSIFYDIICIIHAVFVSDKLLVLGTSGCIILLLVHLFSQKRIIVNIDGLEHLRAKWNRCARAFLKLSERVAVRYADIIIVDNKIIQNYVRSEYGKDSQLIEYGGDQVLKMQLNKDTSIKYNIQPENYAFKVCRIEPENNIRLIIEAFRDISDLPLILIGNWNKNDYGKLLREENRNFPHIKLLDPIFDQKKLNELRGNCKFYIHGHSAGGTNPSLVEAMNLRLCIIAYDVVFNRETTENKALYFKDKTELKSLMEKIKSGEIDIFSIGQQMKEIAQRRYLWNIITMKYEKLFLQV
jgi:glycosyltransferase involved in cell wall biosynthesis